MNEMVNSILAWLNHYASVFTFVGFVIIVTQLLLPQIIRGFRLVRRRRGLPVLGGFLLLDGLALLAGGVLIGYGAGKRIADSMLGFGDIVAIFIMLLFCLFGGAGICVGIIQINQYCQRRKMQ